MSEKRKKITVTMEEKLQAIKRLNAGEPVKKIAAELGVGRSTVGDWKSKRELLEKWCTARPSRKGGQARKTMHLGKHAQVDEQLFSWYEQLREAGIPVNGPMIKEKALQIKKDRDGDVGDFAASDGWLDRWKKRFGIRQGSTSGETSPTIIEADPHLGQDDSADSYGAAEQEFPSQPIKTEVFASECDTVGDTVSYSEDDSEMNTEEHKPPEPSHPFTFVEPGVLLGDTSVPGSVTGDKTVPGSMTGDNRYGDKTAPVGERQAETARLGEDRAGEERSQETEETRGLSAKELKRLVLLEQLHYYRKAQRLMDIQIRRELRLEREEAAPSQWSE